MSIYINYNVSKSIISHPYFDGLYHPLMVHLGMIYYCFTNIHAYGFVWK